MVKKIIFISLSVLLFTVFLFYNLNGEKIFQSNDKIKTERDSLKNLYSFSSEKLKTYQALINKAISESRKNNSYLIIVIKAEYELFLYKNGSLLQSFPIELGLNPISDKYEEGDNSTPEGEFYICQKIPNSTYYKALLISYPNKEDADRGLKEKLISKSQYNEIQKAISKKEIPPQKTKLGGELEIHGNGHGIKANLKGGKNWTWGCIALSDNDIDKLYQIISVKTPIAIVKYRKEF